MPFEAELNTRKQQNTHPGTVLTASCLGGFVGSLIGGYVIKRTGQYKLCLLVGVFRVSVLFLCHAFTWNGRCFDILDLHHPRLMNEM